MSVHGQRVDPVRLLIIDDEQTVVMHLREVCKSFGYKPLVSTNPDHLFSILAEESVELILLDYYMGSVTGLDLMRQLHDHPKFSAIPVLFLTGEQNEEILGRCFDAGAADFLHKPVKPIELRARINACLRINQERRKYEDLLGNILPGEITKEIMFKGYSDPRFHDQVTIGLTDFTDFTRSVASWPPARVVEVLHRFFSRFDEIIDRYELTTMKTIGDAYMFAAGMFDNFNCQAIDALKAAIKIREAVSELKKEDGLTDIPWNIRIGVHTGPVVSGIIRGNKIAHDIWGDTVNMAQRMEANSEEGKIQISSCTYQQLPNDFASFKHKIVPIKGKGDVSTYLL